MGHVGGTGDGNAVTQGEPLADAADSFALGRVDERRWMLGWSSGPCECIGLANPGHGLGRFGSADGDREGVAYPRGRPVARLVDQGALVVGDQGQDALGVVLGVGREDHAIPCPGPSDIEEPEFLAPVSIDDRHLFGNLGQAVDERNAFGDTAVGVGPVADPAVGQGIGQVERFVVVSAWTPRALPALYPPRS